MAAGVPTHARGTVPAVLAECECRVGQAILRAGPLITESHGPCCLLRLQGAATLGESEVMRGTARRPEGFAASILVLPATLDRARAQMIYRSLAGHAAAAGKDDNPTSRATAGAAHGGLVGKNAWEMADAFILASRAAHSAKTIGSLAGHFDWRLAAVVAVAGSRCIGGKDTGGHAVRLAHDLHRQGKTLVLLPGPSGRAGPKLVGFLRAAAFRVE